MRCVQPSCEMLAEPDPSPRLTKPDAGPYPWPIRHPLQFIAFSSKMPLRNTARAEAPLVKSEIHSKRYSRGPGDTESYHRSKIRRHFWPTILVVYSLCTSFALFIVMKSTAMTSILPYHIVTDESHTTRKPSLYSERAQLLIETLC